MTPFKIEKNVQPPKKGAMAKAFVTAEQMEIGDSVGGLSINQRGYLVLALDKLYSVYEKDQKGARWNPRKKRGFKSVKEDKVNHLYRVWRIL